MKAWLLIAILVTSFSCTNNPVKERGNPRQNSDSVKHQSEKAIDEDVVNHNLISFLNNPLDLMGFKSIKGQSLSSVTNGLDYHFKPEITDSIFYSYFAFPNDTGWSTLSPIEVIVFKHGKNKHTWHDPSEILIEFTITGKDSAFKKTNLVGLSLDKIKDQFGPDYQIFDNIIFYSFENKVLILKSKESTVQWFKYVRLNTESVTRVLVEEIVKNTDLYYPVNR